MQNRELKMPTTYRHVKKNYNKSWQEMPKETTDFKRTHYRIVGRAYSHRIPLVELRCVSPKRRKEMTARLGGEPGGARGVDSQRHGPFRSLL